MTARARRLVAVVLILAIALVIGRGVVGFLAERWWASAISPEAASAIRRWQWLGLLLDAGAIAIASGWFAIQAVLVARSIATVQVQHRVGGLAVRELVPTRLLVLGAVACGILLGILTGVGAGAWRDAVALAWRGVHYGVIDPALGVDIGVYVARLPAWELAHEFAIMLTGLGLAFVVTLYAAIGAIALGGRRLTIHPYARRHVGLLFAVVALVLAWGYLLTPYHLAVDQAGRLSQAALETRIVAAHVVVGVALAVTLLTMRWAVAGRNVLLLAAWGVLVATITVERTIVPVFVAGELAMSEPPEFARDLGDRLYGIRRLTPRPVGPTPEVHDHWDQAALQRFTFGTGRRTLLAVPSPGALPAWQVISLAPDGPGTLQVNRFVADSVAIDGSPVLAAPAVSIEAPLTWPGREGWAPQRGGVPAGNIVRRGVLAWALQVPGMFGLAASDSITWRLDPIARLTALIPTVSWRTVGFVAEAGEPRWVVSGFAIIQGVPHGIASSFDGQRINGAVPALAATVGARTGLVEVWLDPAADSLGSALAGLHRPLVRRDQPVPAAVVAVLGYPVEWFQAQLSVLHPQAGGLTSRGLPETLAPNALVVPGGGGVQALLEGPGPDEVVTLITGSRTAGIPGIEIRRLDPALPSAIGAVSDGWRASAGFSQVYDSLRASGDTLLAGPLRWSVGANGLSVWRTYGSAGLRGPPRLLWLGIATNRGIEGSRPGSLRWGERGNAGEVPVVSPEFLEQARLEAARSWLMRADSALSRGDLTAFGRAWDALRRVLSDSGRE